VRYGNIRDSYDDGKYLRIMWRNRKGKELLEQQEMAEYMERHGERYGQGY